MGACLWIADGEARARFDAGPVDERIGLRDATLDRIHELAAWHDRAMNPDDPLAPSLWRQDECDRFNAAARELLERIRSELGPAVDVVNGQEALVEDPDLDRYLANRESVPRYRSQAPGPILTLANAVAARFDLPSAETTSDPEAPLLFSHGEGALRVTRSAGIVRVDVTDEGGWLEVFRSPVWAPDQEGFDEPTGLSFTQCLEYAFSLLRPDVTLPPKGQTDSHRRRSPKHCPVCEAPLEKNARRTRLMNACDACHARLSSGRRCNRCNGAEVWENKREAGCRRCGLHGPKAAVIGS